MQDVRREERVELCVEVWVFEVVVADEGEDAAEGEHGDDPAHVVRRHQEVGQQEGAGQVRHDLRFWYQFGISRISQFYREILQNKWNFHTITGLY